MRDLALNETLSHVWADLRRQRPLIHNITNYVTANFVANTLLAAGASPIMAGALEEMNEIVSISSALVINIGTIRQEQMPSILAAAKAANQLGKPIVLDPVGIGASSLRAAVAQNIIGEYKVNIVRGNCSEIMTMGGQGPSGKGLDSAHKMEEAHSAALRLAKEMQALVVATGPVDLVTDGYSIIRVANGHPRMADITGTGCAISALVGAASVVAPDNLRGAATALAAFGLAGEKAMAYAKGPGSFAVAILDELYNMTPEHLQDGADAWLETGNN